jgi:hypothetical protein
MKKTTLHKSPLPEAICQKIIGVEIKKRTKNRLFCLESIREDKMYVATMEQNPPKTLITRDNFWELKTSPRRVK